MQGDGSFCYKTEGGVRYTLRNVDIGGINGYDIGPPPPTIQIRPSRVRAFTVTPRINVSNQNNNGAGGRSGNQGLRTRTTRMRTRNSDADNAMNGHNENGGNVRARRGERNTDEVFSNPRRNPKAALSMSDEFAAQLVIHIVRPLDGMMNGEPQDVSFYFSRGKSLLRNFVHHRENSHCVFMPSVYLCIN